MKLVHHETEMTLPGMGVVKFGSLISRRGTYWAQQYNQTHFQPFNFTVEGRRYWGEIIRTFDREGQPGKRTEVHVELRTDSGKFSRALAATAKTEWRGELRRAFKRNLEAWLEAEDDAARDRAERACIRFGETPTPEAIEHRISVAATGGHSASRESAAAKAERDETEAPAPATIAEAGNASPSVVETIPMNWESCLPLLLAVLENGTTEGRAYAIAELSRMAKVADASGTYRSQRDEQSARAVKAEELAASRLAEAVKARADLAALTGGI